MISRGLILTGHSSTQAWQVVHALSSSSVSISPLDIIVQLRRHLVMEESSAPQEWNGMFSNIENNFAPWKFAPDERDKWANPNP